jgi:hypothetical protein
MKLKQLNQIGMLFALIILSACSKQSGQPTAGANSSNQDASISLRNVYAISLNGAGYLITELENTGKVGITAFQGKWTITDDLGAKVEDQEIKYTSDTPSTWQENGNAFFATLTISRKSSRSHQYFLEWNSSPCNFRGEGMLCDDILIGDYCEV